MRISLSQTLNALIDGINPDHPDMGIEEVEISIPLLVQMEHGPNGPVFHASPPYSAFLSGVNPVAHMARIQLKKTAAQTAIPATQAPPTPAE